MPAPFMQSFAIANNETTSGAIDVSKIDVRAIRVATLVYNATFMIVPWWVPPNLCHSWDETKMP